MHPDTKHTILNKLREIESLSIIDTIDWPIAYCKDLNNIKAIVLGCDPSNHHDNKLKYAFGIETPTKSLKQLFAGVEMNLNELGFTTNDIYVQNICQNYFSVETSKNNRWHEAAKIWLPFLKNELDNSPISKETPLLLTAEDIYLALIRDGIKKYKPKELYSNTSLVPIRPEDNYLNRPLFPLFRGGHGYYNLKKWPDYVAYFKNNFKS